jgi:hypothetical protein
MVASRGIPIYGETQKQLTAYGVMEDIKREYPNVKFLGLFDTVGSFGKPGNAVNIGIRLSLAKNVLKCAHAMSAHDARETFPLTRLKPDPRVKERWFAGVHADIGGVYGDKEVQGRVSLYWMWQQAKDAGLAAKPFPVLWEKEVENYLAKNGVGWSPRISDVLKIAPMHDSASPLQYIGDRFNRWVRSKTGQIAYRRRYYVR